jgi:predicted ABC-type ATPase
VPQLWVVAGPNGAGKTTLVLRRLAHRIPVVNADTIAQELPRVAGRLDERRAGEVAIERRNAFLAARAHFAVETTLTGSSALRLMRVAGSAGYKITLVYVGLASADLSVQRVLDRVRQGGHPVPVTALERRYPDTLSKLEVALALADRSYVFDNSGERRRLLLIRELDRNRWVASDLPPWITSSLATILD